MRDILKKVIDIAKKNRLEVISGGAITVALVVIVVAIGIGSNKEDKSEVTSSKKSVSSAIEVETTVVELKEEVETNADNKVVAVKLGDKKYNLEDYKDTKKVLKDGTVTYIIGKTEDGSDRVLSIKSGDKTNKVSLSYSVADSDSTGELDITTNKYGEVETTTVAETTTVEVTTTVAVTEAPTVVTQATTKTVVQQTQPVTEEVKEALTEAPVVDDSNNPAVLSGMASDKDWFGGLADNVTTALTRHFTSFPTDRNYTYLKNHEPSFPAVETWSYGELYTPTELKYTNGNGHWFTMKCFYYRALSDHTEFSFIVPKLEDKNIYEKTQDLIAQSLGAADRMDLYMRLGGSNATIYLGNFEGLGPISVCFMLKWN
jgi:hypothetical protein